MAETVKRKERYDNIDGLRTIACFGIIAMHIKANSNYQISGWFFDDFISSFSLFVFLFIMISGFGMCCGFYDRFKNKQIDLNDFYTKRYFKILPYFITLILIDLVLDFSWEHLAEGIMEATMLFGLLPFNELSVIGVSWTLGIIFLFYIMFPFFVFLFDNRKRGWLVFLISVSLNVLCVLYFFSADFVHDGFTPRHNILYCLPYFCAGCLLYLYRKEVRETVSRHCILSLLLCILITVLFYVFVYPNTTILPVELILYLPWLIYSIGVKSRILSNRFVAYFSKISMECYLSHMVIFRLLEKIHCLYLINDRWIGYCLSFILTVTGLVLFIGVWKKVFEYMIAFMKRKNR